MVCTDDVNLSYDMYVYTSTNVCLLTYSSRIIRNAFVRAPSLAPFEWQVYNVCRSGGMYARLAVYETMWGDVGAPKGEIKSSYISSRTSRTKSCLSRLETSYEIQRVA